MASIYGTFLSTYWHGRLDGTERGDITTSMARDPPRRKFWYHSLKVHDRVDVLARLSQRLIGELIEYP